MFKRILIVMIMIALTASPAVAQQRVSVDFDREGAETYATNVRRHLHQNPEVRWQEEGTLEFIRTELDTITTNKSESLSVHTHEFKGGMVVDVITDTSYGWRLFRADIDALPVQEETGLPFTSQIDGKMHACGHDFHVGMLLAAFREIVEGRVAPKYNLRFVFQRAEENPINQSGGHSLVYDDNVTDGMDEVYALHVLVDETLQPGTFTSGPGAIFANNDQFRINVKTQGGHAMDPHRGSNAIDVMVDIHVALRGFDRRSLGPFEPASITPVVSLAGVSGQANVRPGEGEIWYSARSFLDADGRQRLEDDLRRRIEGVAATYPDDVQIDYEFVRGYPVTVNDPGVYTHSRQLLEDAGYDASGILKELGSEDMSYYQLQVPGAYWMLGVWQEGSGGHHSSTFNPTEEFIGDGINFWLLLATQ